MQREELSYVAGDSLVVGRSAQRVSEAACGTSSHLTQGKHFGIEQQRQAPLLT